MTAVRSVITGTGSFLPAEVVPSRAIEARHGLPEGWCAGHVGILERRRADLGMTSWQLGAEAARKAIEASGRGPGDVDHVLFHTSIPETHYPTPGVFLAGRLGLTGEPPILEVKAACTTFLSLLHLADGLIRSGLGSRILLVCAERLHDNCHDYEATAPLFGDAAAAAVVEARPQADVGDAGVIWSRNWTDGAGAALCVAAGTTCGLFREDPCPPPPELEQLVADWAGRDLPASGIMSRWDGAAIFRSAVRSMGKAIDAALEATGLAREDVDHFLVHQANAKILSSLLRQYRLPEAKVPSNIASYGNTSSATVPILLDEGTRSGRIGPGDLVVMAAFGAGFTYGSVVYRVPGSEVRT